MKTGPMVVAVFAILVWASSAPLAMAPGDCMAMWADCEGPCGVSSCVAPGFIADDIVPAVARVPSGAAPGWPSAPLRLPDLPPRTTLLSA